ncbi:hypothetical protein FD13_GL001481 [Levilactobacillus senmaizukei DSM 21775 = NBRC 103853]|uniref:Uncharacterized protein n=2 Tax=Levilactobacillus senmaizukei TaxID=431273 RepID=A0A0R2DR21_9LACO|nr:hypothetical protein FD13_GL001481 [Levilactobacillus senmaizukei DSM 21775 = NBRC 103853]
MFIMLRRFARLPDGWLFLAGYCLIGLGYLVFGLLATVTAVPFLIVVIGYFLVAAVLTAIKSISLRDMDLTRLNFLIFELVTVAGFLILLFTIER